MGSQEVWIRGKGTGGTGTPALTARPQEHSSHRLPALPVPVIYPVSVNSPHPSYPLLCYLLLTFTTMSLFSLPHYKSGPKLEAFPPLSLKPISSASVISLLSPMKRNKQYLKGISAG